MQTLVRLGFALGMGVWLLLPSATAAAGIDVSTGAPAGSPLTLVGSRDRRQLVVTSTPGGPETARDVTGVTAWRVEPATLATVRSGGLVVPLANGVGTILASVPGAAEVGVPLVVERFADDPPIDFVSQIVPIFTKHGCNGGGCHGKTGGQNGFRLSLLGFEPADDQEHIVLESRGRRISPAAPEQSLLVNKATAQVPHGGGRLIEPGSPSHELLVRWIAEGAPPSGPSPPRVSRIDVFPAERMLRGGQQQQLRVLAHYVGGRVEDVTRVAQFESNATDIAVVDAAGLVSAPDPGKGPPRCGIAAVMVRYQGQVGVFRGTTPLETPLEKLPHSAEFVRNFVDEHVLAQLVRLRLPPSGICDDATFLRRVTIDIAGRLPTIDEAKAFAADPSPGKREAVVERLLDSPDYAEYFAMKWSAVLRNARTFPQDRNGSYSFHDWIRGSLSANKPYSEFVRDLIVASGDASANPAVIWYRQVNSPDKVVEDVAQLFLGMRMQCAKCHHHPFEKWGMSDYWQMTAFFSTIGRKNLAAGSLPNEQMIYHKRGMAKAAAAPKNVANTPAVLGGPPLSVDQDTDPRVLLADWLVAADNPFLAKSLVNRYWKHFFSIGIVEPEDDMRITNPATNPALLDALAKSFVESNFDLKKLIRTICTSRTYQLSSEPGEFNAADRQNFSRFYARRLPAEVALDAIDSLAGSRTGFEGVLPGTRSVALPDPGFDNYFLTVFGRPKADSACECERVGDTNLSQSLHMMNSSEILGKVAGGRAAKLAADENRPLGERVGELFMIAFSRPPRPEELAKIGRYVTSHADRPKQAWEDVVWSVLNSKEFLFNH